MASEEDGLGRTGGEFPSWPALDIAVGTNRSGRGLRATSRLAGGLRGRRVAWGSAAAGNARGTTRNSAGGTARRRAPWTVACATGET